MLEDMFWIGKLLILVIKIYSVTPSDFCVHVRGSNVIDNLVFINFSITTEESLHIINRSRLLTWPYLYESKSKC